MKKEYIVELREEEADELMDEHWVGELVRCKECKHFHDMKCSYPERGTCDLWNMLHWGDWYCADGERR